MGSSEYGFDLLVKSVEAILQSSWQSLAKGDAAQSQGDSEVYEIWHLLKERASLHPAFREALDNLITSPNDPDVQEFFYFQLKEMLRQDRALVEKIRELIAALEQREWGELPIETNTAIVFSANKRLTPGFLSFQISPLIKALEGLQHTIDEIEGRQRTEVFVRSITQSSPISLNLGNVAQAATFIRDSIVPWWKKHSKTMIQLMEQEKMAEIEIAKAEALEKHAEAAKKREEAKRLQMENARLRMQLLKEEVELAMNLIHRLAPYMSEGEKMAYVTRLMLPLEVILATLSEAPFDVQVG